MRRLLFASLVLLATVGGLASPARAHPLGNFTVNTYSGLRVAEDRISVDFLVDMAEIPALQHKRDSESPGYAPRECERQAGRLDLRVDDRRLDLLAQVGDVEFPEGQGGLRTLRLTCALSGPIGGLRENSEVTFSSDSFADRVGWREITAVGDGTTLVSTDVPAASISARLTSYPDDLLASPVDQRRARLVVRPGGPPAPAAGTTDPAGDVRSSPSPGSVDRVTRAFTAFVTRQDLTIGFALVALLASVVLGAAHAFAPGHGKTVMAAYLIGQRGSLRQALLIALTVTATHTGGVLALGVVISASSVVAPERLYPWLGTVSGVLLALVGAGILLRLARARTDRGHHHDGHHDHGHDHSHSHGGHHHAQGPVGPDQLVTRRGLLAMGFVGGLLPSPSAVVVLLGAIALGRAWFGVLLVLMYGLGMAATLTGAGLLLVRARDALDARVAGLQRNRALLAATAWLPAVTAGFIVAVGLYLAARGATQI